MPSTYVICQFSQQERIFMGLSLKAILLLASQ